MYHGVQISEMKLISKLTAKTLNIVTLLQHSNVRCRMLQISIGPRVVGGYISFNFVTGSARKGTMITTRKRFSYVNRGRAARFTDVRRETVAISKCRKIFKKVS